MRNSRELANVSMATPVAHGGYIPGVALLSLERGRSIIYAAEWLNKSEYKYVIREETELGARAIRVYLNQRKNMYYNNQITAEEWKNSRDVLERILYLTLYPKKMEKEIDAY